MVVVAILALVFAGVVAVQPDGVVVVTPATQELDVDVVVCAAPSVLSDIECKEFK